MTSGVASDWSGCNCSGPLSGQSHVGAGTVIKHVLCWLASKLSNVQYWCDLTSN